MPLDPLPVNLVGLGGLFQPLPQLLILHRLLIRGLPAAAFPAFQPLGDALFDVLGISRERHVAGTLEFFERTNRGHEFHAVVGGFRLGTVKLLFVVAVLQDGAPTAGTGIATTGAVGVDDDFIQVSWPGSGTAAPCRARRVRRRCGPPSSCPSTPAASA